jgi:pimeloyl-ACP methyl ester carboxylesterase
MWSSMLEAFADVRDDVTILTIDFPGFGDSPIEEHWTMRSLSQQILEVVQKYTRERFILAGLSMGGYAALAFYRYYPSLVRALVLSNTRAEADSESAKANRETFALDALQRGSEAAIERMYSGFVTERTEPDIAVEIRNWMTEAQPVAIAAALRAMAAREDSTELLPLIPVPSLVISGSVDTIIPAMVARMMAEQLLDATYLEIPLAAHLTAVEFPQEWSAALSSFLDRL